MLLNYVHFTNSSHSKPNTEMLRFAAEKVFIHKTRKGDRKTT